MGDVYVGPSPRPLCRRCFESADAHADRKCLFNSYGYYEPVTVAEFRRHLYAMNNLDPAYTGTVEFQWLDRDDLYRVRFYGSDDSFSWQLMEKGAHAKKALPR